MDLVREDLEGLLVGQQGTMCKTGVIIGEV